MEGSGRGLEPTRPVDPADGSARVLLVWEPDGSSFQLTLHEGVLSVGRVGSGADVEVDDPGVSRRHLRLIVGTNVEVEDEGSSNGTLVGGERVPPASRVEVSIGQAITLGSSSLVVGRLAEPPNEDETAMVLPRDLEVAVRKLVGVHTPLTIVGAIGVGKTRLARFMHARRRPRGPLFEVGCRGISLQGLTRELFGYGRRHGALDPSRGGTLLVEDVDEMPADLQQRLTAALGESSRASKAGGARQRLVATLRMEPSAAVRLGTLLPTLQYRLGAVLRVPSLAERSDELRAISEHILAEAAAHKGRTKRVLTAEAVDWIGARGWPGNVRELQNVVVAASASAQGPNIAPADLETWTDASGSAPADDDRARVVAALAEYGGNQSRAAKLLGISRGTLISRIRRYGLVRPKKTP